MDLTSIRQDIDQIDGQLVALLEKRMDLVSQVAQYKQETGKPIYDPEREAALLDKVASRAKKQAYRESLLSSFTGILSASRDYQSQLIASKKES